MKTFFFSNKTLLHRFNFSNFKFFWIFAKKKLIIRAEKTFLRYNTIWHAFYSKFATFVDFEQIQVSFEKPIYFYPKKA